MVRTTKQAREGVTGHGLDGAHTAWAQDAFFAFPVRRDVPPQDAPPGALLHSNTLKAAEVEGAQEFIDEVTGVDSSK